MLVFWLLIGCFQVAMSSVKKDLLTQKGSLVTLYVKPRKSAKKNIYVIGGKQPFLFPKPNKTLFETIHFSGSKRELGSAWTRSECTYQTVECFDTFKQVRILASDWPTRITLP